MPSIDPRSPIPLYHQIEQAITELILEARLAPGARLPSEPELARQFRVSPLTVRKALERLEREGMVVRRRGSGTFVGPVLPVRPAIPGRAGFILHDPASPLLLGLMQAVECSLSSGGLQTLVLFGGFSDELERRRIREAADSAGGLVVWSLCGPLAAREIARLSSQGYPVVLVDRSPSGLDIDCVLVDDGAGALALAGHLLSLGHRRVAFLYGPEPLELSSVSARLRGLQQAVTEWGLPESCINLYQHPAMVSQENLDFSCDLARAILASPDAPTAWFCVNDALAQAMAVSLARLGIRVPQDISLTGFDGMQYLPTGLRLTTVRRDATLMGREAVRLLLDRMTNPDLPARRLVLPVEFAPGETTGPAPSSQPGGSHE